MAKCCDGTAMGGRGRARFNAEKFSTMARFTFLLALILYTTLSSMEGRLPLGTYRTDHHTSEYIKFPRSLHLLFGSFAL